MDVSRCGQSRHAGDAGPAAVMNEARGRLLLFGLRFGKEAAGGGEGGGQAAGAFDDGGQIVLGHDAPTGEGRIPQRAEQRRRVGGGVIGSGSGSWGVGCHRSTCFGPRPPSAGGVEVVVVAARSRVLLGEQRGRAKAEKRCGAGRHRGRRGSRLGQDEVGDVALAGTTPRRVRPPCPDRRGVAHDGPGLPERHARSRAWSSTAGFHQRS